MLAQVPLGLLRESPAADRDDSPVTITDMSSEASGSNWYVAVTDQPLDISKYTQLVTDPGAGAISSFIGTTRNNFQGKAVLRLEYEAYVPMALAKLKVSAGWQQHYNQRQQQKQQSLPQNHLQQVFKIGPYVKTLLVACHCSRSCVVKFMRDGV